VVAPQLTAQEPPQPEIVYRWEIDATAPGSMVNDVSASVVLVGPAGEASFYRSGQDMRATPLLILGPGEWRAIAQGDVDPGPQESDA
jgi:hypothetical protein